MEEKIYKMQVTKLSLSARVVDAQMPENQFTQAETSSLLTFEEDDRDSLEKVIETLNRGSRDAVLASVFEQFTRGDQKWITSIEDQGSLLEDKPDEHLNEDEEKQAELEYELESKGQYLMTAAVAAAAAGGGGAAAGMGLTAEDILASAAAYVSNFAGGGNLAAGLAAGNPPADAIVGGPPTLSSLQGPSPAPVAATEVAQEQPGV
jgi:hypothetical protein